VKQGQERKFVILDTGMTELIRPALYSAWHDIQPLVDSPESNEREREAVEFVGPICESSDVVGRDRSVRPLVRGDRVAILKAGAYGFTMASNYNSRPRPAEVLVSGKTSRVVRARETYRDLIRGEEC